jgi:hypothetical protein
MAVLAPIIDIDLTSKTLKVKDRKAKSGRLLEPSSLVSVSDASISAQNRGASAFVEDSQKNERWCCN